MIRIAGFTLIFITACLSIVLALQSDRCNDVVVNHTVIGTRCQSTTQSPFTEHDTYDIQPEYQIAFLLAHPNFPSLDLFDSREELPPQRIPGTDQFYDFIPPELEPELRVHGDATIRGCAGKGDACDIVILEKRPAL